MASESVRIARFFCRFNFFSTILIGGIVMFAKSLAFSRVVMRWLVCIVVALALSGCAGSSMVSSTDVYKKTIVCSVAGGVTLNAH